MIEYSLATYCTVTAASGSLSTRSRKQAPPLGGARARLPGIGASATAAHRGEMGCERNVQRHLDRQCEKKFEAPGCKLRTLRSYSDSTLKQYRPLGETAGSGRPCLRCTSDPVAVSSYAAPNLCLAASARRLRAYVASHTRIAGCPPPRSDVPEGLAQHQPGDHCRCPHRLRGGCLAARPEQSYLQAQRGRAQCCRTTAR